MKGNQYGVPRFSDFTVWCPQILRLDKGTVSYFKELSRELGMPYQNLINLYLRDCALNHKRLDLKWTS